MNNNQEHLGLVDNPISEPIDNKYMAQDEKAPVEVNQPSINPEPFYPDTNNPVQEYGEYQPNTGLVRNQDQEHFETWERRMRKEQAQAVIDGGIWNKKLTSSGAPFIDDNKNFKKSSPEQLAKLKKEQEINDTANRLALLQNNEARLQKELEKNRQVQVIVRQRLDELNND